MPTYIARSKRTRAIYVVLLCVAIAMSTWAVYNQVQAAKDAQEQRILPPEVTAITFVGNPDDCRFVMTFTDSSQVSTPVRGDLCT